MFDTTFQTDILHLFNCVCVNYVCMCCICCGHHDSDRMAVLLLVMVSQAETIVF